MAGIDLDRFSRPLCDEQESTTIQPDELTLYKQERDRELVERSDESAERSINHDRTHQ